MIKKRLRYLAFILTLLSLLLLIAGCRKSENPEITQHNFDNFINQLFVQQVQSDTLSLNYSLSKPENYGIIQSVITLGEYSAAQMNKRLLGSENHLKSLNSFQYNLLNADQKLTYDILKKYLELELVSGNYLYYNECLGPTTGIQAQLPILLAEYNFYTKKDIDNYIALLPSVYTYFQDIATFEREKSAKGLFMNDNVADRIINQCKSFIVDPENNFLIEYFNEKVSTYKGLSDSEIVNYQEANRDGVLQYIIPAYELIIEVLEELKGTGTNPSGLFHYPQGKEYYECLTKYKTGSNKSMAQMAEMLDREIADGILDITTLSLTDATIMEKYLSFYSFPVTDPEEILQNLQRDILVDFPDPVPVNCEIKYVHDSLSEYLSPAMYLVPAMDDYKNNNIYINGNDENTLAFIYTTVAHEGYPGHLYQCVYFRDKEPAPIRHIMNFLGYDEGWATYVEMYSYHIAGIDANLAKFLESNNRVILCMYARTDIGIHYEGWTRNDVISYVMKFIGDQDIAETIYQSLLEEPAIYLPYAIGFLEIKEMRNRAELELEESFVAKDFHKFLLDIGPAQFVIINKYLDEWLDSKKEQKMGLDAISAPDTITK